MRRRRPKYSPQYVIYYCLNGYMDDETNEYFKRTIGAHKSKKVHEGSFIKTIRKFVDIEQLKDNPLRWQDIWIYNYIHYFAPKDKTLLWQYETEVIKKSESAFRQLVSGLGWD
ncbi:MAG: hypothetical protein JXQ90_21720 [Cyclobacteriaceae bacterium]